MQTSVTDNDFVTISSIRNLNSCDFATLLFILAFIVSLKIDCYTAPTLV